VDLRSIQCLRFIGIDHFSALLAGKPADDADGLVDASGVAKAQLRVVIAFEHFILLDQGFAEEFEDPGIALDGGEALLVSHGGPALGWAGSETDRRWGRSGEI